MKAGADINDQLVISRAVLDAAENNNGVLDVPVLAASLDISLETCQSYVDFYIEKHSYADQIKSPLEVQLEEGI